jgi:hypothetical protein
VSSKSYTTLIIASIIVRSWVLLVVVIMLGRFRQEIKIPRSALWSLCFQGAVQPYNTMVPHAYYHGRDKFSIKLLHSNCYVQQVALPLITAIKLLTRLVHELKLFYVDCCWFGQRGFAFLIDKDDRGISPTTNGSTSFIVFAIESVRFRVGVDNCIGAGLEVDNWEVERDNQDILERKSSESRQKSCSRKKYLHGVARSYIAVSV